MTSFAPLTPRQTQVGQMAATGLTNAQIADRLGITPNTVETVVRDAGVRLSPHFSNDIPARRRLVRFIRSRQATIRATL